MKPPSSIRNLTFAAALSILGAISPTPAGAMTLTEYYNAQPISGVPQPQVSFQLGTDWTLSLATDQLYSQSAGFLVANHSYRVFNGAGNNLVFRFDRQLGDTAAYNVTVNLSGYAQGASNEISLLWGGSAFGVNDINTGAPVWTADTANLTQVATYTGAENVFNWNTGAFTIGASDQNAYLVVLTTANTFGYVYSASADFTALIGNYWAPGAGGGGTGTWSAGGANWAVTAGTQGNGTQSTNTTLLFGNTAGTVTVSNGVNVAAGMTFSTDGYTVTNSTITLTGANAASNTITADAAVGATIASQLAGSNGMTKAGTGTLTLTASNTYTGATTVSAGTLVVDGSISSATTVQSGATLGGSGTIGGPTTISGTLAPGNSPGKLTLTNGLTLSGGGNYNWQIFGLTGDAGQTNTWDLIDVTGGTWDISGLSSTNKFNINLWSLGALPDTTGAVASFDATQNYSWKILASVGLSTNSTFNADYFNINKSAINGTGGFVGATGLFSLELDGNNDLFLNYTGAGAAVPEPGTWAAAALLVAAAGLRRALRRKAAPEAGN